MGKARLTTVHKEEISSLQRTPLLASVEFLFAASLACVPLPISNQCFSTSAKLCIWCPNAFIIRHPRVPVYMPVKHLFFPVENSVGICAPPTLPALDVSSGVNLTMSGSSVEKQFLLKRRHNIKLCTFAETHGFSCNYEIILCYYYFSLSH